MSLSILYNAVTNESLLMNATSQEEETNFTIADVDISITVPPEVSNFSSQGLVFTSYMTPILFQAVPTEGTNRSTYEYRVDTSVLGFSIANMNFTNLSNPVTVTLQSIRARQNLVSHLTL